MLACLGNTEAHGEVLRALASADDKEVQVAQTYVRHRPVSEKRQLKTLVGEVTRMRGAAQVRALDTIARLNISDREVLEELSRTYAETRSHEVQRAIAEVFIRSDPKALPRPGLATVLRQHRLKPSMGGHDLIDALLARLQAG